MAAKAAVADNYDPGAARGCFLRLFAGTAFVIGLVIFVALLGQVRLPSGDRWLNEQRGQLALERERMQLDREREEQRLALERLRQQTELDLARARVLYRAQTLAAASLWLVIPAGLMTLLALAWLYALPRREPLVWPDMGGRLPVARRLIARGETVDASWRYLDSWHETQRISAVTRAVEARPMPHIYHYSPKYEGLSRPSITDNGEMPGEMPLALPGVTDMASVVLRPTLDNILLALGPGGEPLVVPAGKLWHIALAGATGGGKSNTMRLLLTQLLAAGAQVVLADPHYTPLDPESGDDWRPIEVRLMMRPAVRIKEIADLIHWIAEEELPRRLELRRNSQPWGEPIFLAVDELPAIAAKWDKAMEMISLILREGRKVQVLAVTAAQDFLVKSIGGSGAARENLRTCYYFGGDASTARTLLDLQGRVEDGGLGAGLAMLRCAVTPHAQVVRVPLASNEAVGRLLGPPVSAVSGRLPPVSTSGNGNGHGNGASSGAKTDVEPGEKKLDPRAERVRQMILDGVSTSQVIKDVWQVSSGNSYMRAAEEFNEVLRSLL